MPLLLGLCLAAALFRSGTARAEPTQPAAVEEQADPAQDGWPDLSEFLDTKFGFLPIVMPITEPAVGYGAAFGAAFMSKPFGAARAGLGRPNITFVGGMATENGTWGVIAGDMRYWLDDRLQTLAGVVVADVNLDYHGIGQDSVLSDDPLRYTLHPIALGLQAKYRIGDTRIWGGLNYVLALTEVTFDASANMAELPDYDSTTRIGGVTLVANYDSRDNLFTPLSGSLIELSFGFFGKALGGQDSFELGKLIAIQYFALPYNLFFGMRGDAGMSFRDAPFYVRPSIQLRGVPRMRYQGEEVAQLELELRWQFWRRLSLIAFGGAGAAWNDFEKLDNSSGVIAGGPGIRYELARSYGIHMGIDVGFSKDATAFYIQVGNAWFRP